MLHAQKISDKSILPQSIFSTLLYSAVHSAVLLPRSQLESSSRVIEMSDYVLTIDSDQEEDQLDSKHPQEAEETGLNPEFVFDVSGDPYEDLLANDVIHSGTKPVSLYSLVWLRPDWRI